MRSLPAGATAPSPKVGTTYYRYGWMLLHHPISVEYSTSNTVRISKNLLYLYSSRHFS
ncbi:MAG: hypothetical protein ACFB02_08730 [Mastigocoleus sp.]